MIHGILLGIVAVAHIVAFVAVVRLRSSLVPLASVVPFPAPQPPVTIVVPARDEEATLAPALRSLLAQQYSHLRVVVVDDRSTDGTGALLDRFAAGEPRLRVVHLSELPGGWLGKLNALAHGVAHADGEWLLFLDADVKLAPDALARAVAWAASRDLDCVSVIPAVEPSDLPGDLAYVFLGALAAVGTHIERIRDSADSHVVGLGAFLLVRASAFRRTPGFAWMPLEVADDIGLALLIKSHGGRVDLLRGAGMVRLRWYDSWLDMTRKMQKNWFGIIGRFSPLRTAAVGFFLVALGILPLAIGLHVGLHRVYPILAGIWFFSFATALAYARQFDWPRRAAPLAFLSSVPVGVTALIAAWRGWREGGISWRGTRYPSATLAAAQRVRFRPDGTVAPPDEAG